MANTTNYNWETPDDTDLVKDGAAAIRTLGSSVDTTTKALNPSTTLGDIEYRSATANTNTRLAIGTTGQVLSVVDGVPAWATSDDANAIQNAIVDAKGDIVAASAADTPARLAVGTDNQRLVAASGEATGLKYVSDTQNTVIDAVGDLLYGTAADTIGKLAIGSTGNILTVAGGVPTWAAPAGGGGMTSIASGSLSGSSLSLTSISASYKDLVLVLRDATWTGGGNFQMKLNNDTTADCYVSLFQMMGSSYATNGVVNNTMNINESYNPASGAQDNSLYLTLLDYANTTCFKMMTWESQFKVSTYTLTTSATATYKSTSAINRIDILPTGSTWSAGTYILYGVN
jgi:hypothetical protein